MLASRGMGDINPSKMPKARGVKKRDGDYPVDMYAEGGKAAGKQFVKQPTKVAAKTARYR